MIFPRITHLAKPRPLLTEQGSLGNTSRIHTTKRNTRTIMISPMQFTYSHHITNLTVFVGFGTEEWLTVGHGNGIFGTCFEALEFA